MIGRSKEEKHSTIFEAKSKKEAEQQKYPAKMSNNGFFDDIEDIELPVHTIPLFCAFF